MGTPQWASTRAGGKHHRLGPLPKHPEAVAEALDVFNSTALHHHQLQVLQLDSHAVPLPSAENLDA